MIRPHILLFIISFLCLTTGVSQEAKDSIAIKDKYGLRLGVDVSQPIISYIEENNVGLEIVGDVRFSPNWFVAFELGYKDITTQEDFFNFTTKGSFAKIGLNYNAYRNWLDMNNEIFVGFRYGISMFDHIVHSYTPNQYGNYYPAQIIDTSIDHNDLTAHWAELIVGLKVETFKNLFLGASMSFKNLITADEPENFKNLFIPGFNRVFTNDSGVGFNYTISYLIPIVKK